MKAVRRKGGGVPLGIEIMNEVTITYRNSSRKGGGVPLGIEMLKNAQSADASCMSQGWRRPVGD